MLRLEKTAITAVFKMILVEKDGIDFSICF